MTPILKDGKTTIPPETIESIQRNKVALKGPLAVSNLKLCMYVYALYFYFIDILLLLHPHFVHGICLVVLVVRLAYYCIGLHIYVRGRRKVRHFFY